MATLPRHPPSWSQRIASPTVEPASAEQSRTARTNSVSAASVDSQTLLLNSPPAESEKPTEVVHQDAAVQVESQTPEDEPRRCWICFNDETEDDGTSSEWRSPCPCVLVAHETCLLDWIADMEAHRVAASLGRILCPQCKSEIRLQRPRSLVVESVRVVENLAKKLIYPGSVFAISGAALSFLTMFGHDTLIKIFGVRDAIQILQTSPLRLHGGNASISTLVAWNFTNWRINLGIPTIPIVLVLSRTKIADSFLPFIPLVFFASGGGVQQDNLLPLAWPPSAAFSFAALPYVRSIYNTYYDRVWLRHERRWLKEVEPRANAVEDNNRAEQGGQDDAEAVVNAIVEEDADENDGDDVVEVVVDADLLFDWQAGGPGDNNNAPENPPVPIARGPGPPLPMDEEAPAARVLEHDDVAPAPNVPQQPAQPRRERVRREVHAEFAIAGFAETFLGACIFPTIAGMMGEALKVALPASWVTPPASGKPTGFLQTKWARSIVGGCLFVGLKDAVLLYVRWKMAQSHRQRRVLNYDASKGKGKGKKKTTT